MSKIKLTVTDVVTNGKQISFVAPCNSEDVTGLVINNTTYDIVDTIGNSICGKCNMWVNGSVISVILNTTTHKAYIQNANSVPVDGWMDLPSGTTITYDGERLHVNKDLTGILSSGMLLKINYTLLMIPDDDRLESVERVYNTYSAINYIDADSIELTYNEPYDYISYAGECYAPYSFDVTINSVKYSICNSPRYDGEYLNGGIPLSSLSSCYNRNVDNGIWYVERSSNFITIMGTIHIDNIAMTNSIGSIYASNVVTVKLPSIMQYGTPNFVGISILKNNSSNSYKIIGVSDIETGTSEIKFRVLSAVSMTDTVYFQILIRI